MATKKVNKDILRHSKEVRTVMQTKKVEPKGIRGTINILMTKNQPVPKVQTLVAERNKDKRIAEGYKIVKQVGEMYLMER